MTDPKITAPAMTELTPQEDQKLKELAVDYFEGNPLGLPPRPAVIEGMREALTQARNAFEKRAREEWPGVDLSRDSRGDYWHGGTNGAFREFYAGWLAALALPDSKPDNQGGA